MKIYIIGSFTSANSKRLTELLKYEMKNISSICRGLELIVSKLNAVGIRWLNFIISEVWMQLNQLVVILW